MHLELNTVEIVQRAMHLVVFEFLLPSEEAPDAHR